MPEIPVTNAKAYEEQMADELCFLDITASHEGRRTIIDVVERVANEVFMPLTVGGGIKDIRTYGTYFLLEQTR